MARSVVVSRDNAIAFMSTQRRLLEQAGTLEEALENERRLTAQQRNFVSMTSHEFRTPLTIVDGQAQRLIKMKDRFFPSYCQKSKTALDSRKRPCQRRCPHALSHGTASAAIEVDTAAGREDGRGRTDVEEREH
jgi:signal transduction histidine kinase